MQSSKAVEVGMAGKTKGERQVTVRIPEPLFEEITRVAKKRRTSFNKLAQEGLQRIAEADLERDMRDAYALLATDAESSVETFWSAQSEVVLSDPG
jgi:hypothetical protein